MTRRFVLLFLVVQIMAALSLLRATQNRNDLDLQLIVGASALLYRFGSVIDVIRDDGFNPNSIVHSIVEAKHPLLWLNLQA